MPRLYKHNCNIFEVLSCTALLGFNATLHEPLRHFHAHLWACLVTCRIINYGPHLQLQRKKRVGFVIHESGTLNPGRALSILSSSVKEILFMRQDVLCDRVLA